MPDTDFNVSDVSKPVTPIEAGLTLIEAGAGTGKTYSLIRIIARQIVELNISIDKILVVTFTRAATAEIKSRLHELLSEIITASSENTDNDLLNYWKKEKQEVLPNIKTNISQALANFDSANVLTIDSFSQRLLKESAFEANSLFSTELDPDDAHYINNALHDYWREHVYNFPPEKLQFFNEFITFDNTLTFVTEALRTTNAKLAPDYDQNPDSLSADYLQAWKHCLKLFKKHLTTLENFIKNPIDGIKKTVNPFRKGAPEKFLTSLHQLLQKENTTPKDVQPFAKLSASYILTENAFNKNKFKDLSKHELAELFYAIDKFITSYPQGIASAYYGEILRYCRERIQSIKESQYVQGYSDITNKLANLLSSESPASRSIIQNTRNRYQACLIDEFQDTSPEQCQIFLNLFKHDDRYFHIVGDPKQSIYRFRGADVFSYLTAKKQTKHLYNLRTNYRSTPRMVNAINELFKSSDDPFLTNGKISFTPSLSSPQTEESSNNEPVLNIHLVSKSIGNAPQIKEATVTHLCNSIHKLLESSKKASDIAILVRNAHEGESAYKELSKQHIPATLSTKSSLIKSEESQQLLTILSAILEHRRSSLLRTALLTPQFESGKIFDQLDDDTFNQISQHTAELHKIWNEQGLMPMMLECIQHHNIRNNLLMLPQGKRRVTNFLHLIELLDAKARKEKLSPSAILIWLKRALQDEIKDIDTDTIQLRIPTDDDAVQIITQHACKGLEYPIVFTFCPSKTKIDFNKISLCYHDPETLESHFAPVENKQSKKLGEDGFEEHQTLQDLRAQEECADAARLAYVALTRSKHLCHFYLTEPDAKKPENHAMYRMLNVGSFDELSEKLNPFDTIHCDIITDDIFSQPTSIYTSPLEGQANGLAARPTETITLTHKQKTTSFTSITRYAPDIIQHHDEETIAPTQLPEKDESFWSKLQAGASLGLVFHEVLEETNFQKPNKLKKLITHKLKQHRPWKKEPNEFHSIIKKIETHILQWLKHPFHNGFALNQISNQQRINEAEFLLTGKNFSLSALADVLDKDPPKHLPASYTQQLRSMSEYQLEGYLTGFIDLIFEHNGKYHILDWKTNTLPLYDQGNLAITMADHHYYLQYHLYTLALDRFLNERLPNYSPATHLGNTYYLFLRGIDSNTPNNGIFTDTITPARLQKLRQVYKT